MVDQPRESASAPHFTPSDPLAFLGLRENPFLDNVNPRYFFRTGAHEEAWLRMKQCIEEHISMGLITARSGTGKTLLTQILLEELRRGPWRPVLILAYPRISRSALLAEIASELQAPAPARSSLHDLIAAVQRRIVELHTEGVKPVIMIDEVHFLGGDALHLLRTLSNMETPTRKLVTILLFGEETFLDKLDDPRYRAILSRAFIRSVLAPLSAQEVEQYVKFRCLMAGGRPDLFAPDAFPLIHLATEGVPREINRLCHNALSLAAEAGRKSIGAAILEKVLQKDPAGKDFKP